MVGQPAPPASPKTGLDVWWMLLGRIVARLLATREHCDVIIQLKDGHVQLVRMNHSYLPDSLPRV